MKNSDHIIAEKQLAVIREIIRETASQDAHLVLATYTREEFSELRPGEDYDVFKRQERIVAEALAREGLAHCVVFQEVDSVGYYRYIARHGLKNCDSSRAAYAAEVYRYANRDGVENGL